MYVFSYDTSLTLVRAFIWHQNTAFMTWHRCWRNIFVTFLTHSSHTSSFRHSLPQLVHCQAITLYLLSCESLKLLLTASRCWVMFYFMTCLGILQKFCSCYHWLYNSFIVSQFLLLRVAVSTVLPPCCPVQPRVVVFSLSLYSFSANQRLIDWLMFSAMSDVNSRVSTLRLLVALLPTVNRDSLWYLLTFLGCVAKHSDDKLDDSGLTVSRRI